MTDQSLDNLARLQSQLATKDAEIARMKKALNWILARNQNGILVRGYDDILDRVYMNFPDIRPGG